MALRFPVPRIFPLVLWAASAAFPAPAVQAQQRGPTVVLVTKSDACPCQLSLCVAAEQEVRNFVADTGGQVGLVIVDLARTPEAGKTYKAFAVPVVILQDEKGEALGRFYGYVEESHLLREWNEYRQKKESQ